MNDYDKAIGVWVHKIGAIEHKIVPKEGDNMKIARVMKGTKNNGVDWLYEQLNTIYFEMVARDNPQLSEDQKPKLRLWIEKNQVQIQKDLMVAFGWQTKEQQDKFENLDGTELKKLINA